MLKIFLLYFVLILGFYSCNKNESEIIEEKFPVLIDTFTNEYADFSCDTFEFHTHFPYFIGKMKDSIIIDYALYPRFYRDCLEDSTGMKSTCDTNHFMSKLNSNSIQASNESIRLVVDTNSILGFYNYRTNGNPYSKAFPVYIENISFYKVRIGVSGILNIKYQAKNKNGDWREIERVMHWYCGTGLVGMLLFPNEIAITSVLKYSGSFKTKLRVELDGVYSNEFTGYVNPTQFGNEY